MWREEAATVACRNLGNDKSPHAQIEILLKALLLAHRSNRRDRAAPPTRRLAAGVGSRTALSRTAAGRMGPARLAEQTRTAEAQPGRVLGRAVVAARKMGGRDVSRLAIRHTNTAEESRLHFRGRADFGLGHRREHCDLQCRECGIAAIASLPGP